MNNVTAAPSLSFRFPRILGSTPVVPFVALFASLVAGTGGVHQTSSLVHSSVFDSNPFLPVDGMRRRMSSVSCLAGQLLKIRTGFALNMSELADVFGVSRPTAYSWLQGAAPKLEFQEKIWRLGSQADTALSLKIPRINLLLRRPVADGRTLLEAVKSGTDVEAVLIQLHRLSVVELSQPSPLRRRATQKMAIRSADEVSIPIISRG